MRTVPPISLVVRHCSMMQKLRPLLGITFRRVLRLQARSRRITHFLCPNLSETLSTTRVEQNGNDGKDVRIMGTGLQGVQRLKSIGRCSRVSGSVLLFLAEFLKSGIGAQRVPDRIEPKKGRRNGRWVIKPATIRRL